MANHYTYSLLMRSPQLEEMMNHELPWLYVGVRSCECAIEDDPYMGSSQHVNVARKLGLEFDKEILQVHPTRTHANQHEIVLLKQFKADGIWGYLFNRVIPGEFGKIDYHNRVRLIVAEVAARKTFSVSAPRANRRGGPTPGYQQSPDHIAHVAQAISSHWLLMKTYCELRGIATPGKGACNVDREDFQRWKSSFNVASTAVQSGESGEYTALTPGHATALAEPLSSILRNNHV